MIQIFAKNGNIPWTVRNSDILHKCTMLVSFDMAKKTLVGVSTRNENLSKYMSSIATLESTADKFSKMAQLLK